MHDDIFCKFIELGLTWRDFFSIFMCQMKCNVELNDCCTSKLLCMKLKRSRVGAMICVSNIGVYKMVYYGVIKSYPYETIQNGQI